MKSSTSNGKGKAVDTSADDDFDDFQSATGTTNTTTAQSSIMPAMYSAPPVQSRPSAPTSTTSFTSSFTNLSISSPPIAQPTRSPNPQTSFGLPPPSLGKPLTSPMSSQPNYFSQAPAPTTVRPQRKNGTDCAIDCCTSETFRRCIRKFMVQCSGKGYHEKGHGDESQYGTTSAAEEHKCVVGWWCHVYSRTGTTRTTTRTNWRNRE